MKFFPRVEFQCGGCGAVVWTQVLEGGKCRVRCTNRSCENHNRLYDIEVPALEAVEVLKEQGGG